MPRHFLDELDDGLALDGQTSLTGGQVSNVRANLLSANQGSLLQDMDAEVNGEARTRRGWRCFGNLLGTASPVACQGLHWFDSITGEYLLAIVDGDLYRCDAGGTWTLVETSAVNSATALADLAQINDRVFASTRDSRPRHWNTANLGGAGTAQVETATVGSAATASANVIVTTTGVGLTGSPIVTNVPVVNGDTKQTVAGKIRTALGGVAAITAVYTVGGSGEFITLTRTIPAANDSTLNLALDGTTNSTGVANAPTSANTTPGALYGTPVTDGPAKLAYLTAQKFRLFGINPDAIDELQCSAYLPDGLTPFTAGTPISTIRIGEGEGDPITGLFAWKGFTLLVFKEGSIWAVDTTADGVVSGVTDMAEFTISRLSGRTGCVAHRSVAMAGNDVLFLARDGVRSLAKTVGDEAGAVSEALSFPIEDYIQRIHWAYAHQACAAYWNGRYLLAVPLDDATRNSHILVYRPQTNAWSVWTGLQPVQFAVSRFNGAPQKLALLDARGNVLVWRDYVAPDTATTTDFRDEFIAGADSRIAWRVQTRALTFGEPLNPKAMEFLELEFVRSTALVDVQVLADGEYRTPLAHKLDSGTPGLTLPFVLPAVLGSFGVTRRRRSMTHYDPAREIVIELREPEPAQMTLDEAADSGVLSLRALQAGAFITTMETDE